MVVDTSAIVAIVFQEPEGPRLAQAILTASSRFMSVVNCLEVTMVVEGKFGREAANDAALLLDELDIRPVAMDTNQLREAIDAWRRYGKGRHRASLNMADCCAYGAATALGEELLFKGSDFIHTDVRQVIW